jgi:MFS family permease
MISVLGSSAAFTALTIVIYRRTGSPTWISLTLFATFGVRGAMTFVAGPLGDRFDRRRVMIVSELASAAVFVVMAFVAEPLALVGLAVLAAVVTSPFEPAAAAAIPGLAGEDRLSWANGLISIGRNIGFSLGPVLGGALAAALGARSVFLVNAASFLGSAALVALVPGPFPGTRSDDATTLAGLRRGVRHILGDRVLLALATAELVLVIGMGLALVADLPLVDLFDAGSFGYGVMYGAWGVGLVVGSAFGRRMSDETEPFWVLAGAVILTIEGIAVALSPWFALVIGLIFVGGVGDAMWLVASLGIRQRRTPDELRSRVIAASDAMTWLAYLPGLAVAGWLTTAVGPRWVYAIFAVTALGATLILIPARRWAARPIPVGVPSPVP